MPVCPLTFRPLSHGFSGAQIHQPQRAPSKQPHVDLLGHALHDQLVSSRLSSTSVLKSSVHTQADTPRKNGHKSLPLIPDDDARMVSDFTIVGAATRKGPESSGVERAAEAASDDTIQWDHRKLLPPDLRPSTQYRYASRECSRDRKARRIVWIAKEIEKVEGYTGEKVGGFRYDGDDIIIQLSKAVYYARRRKEHANEKPASLPQMAHRHPRTSHAPPTAPKATRTISPPPIASRETYTGDPILSRSRTSVSLGSGTTACGTSTDAADFPAPALNSQVTKNVSLPSEGSASASVLDRTSTLVVSTNRDSEAVTQTRGLGFLERQVHGSGVVIAERLFDYTNHF